jgi:cytochrome oxidase Cu insertion factor (SCO1/SenC/PrrC family)
MKKTMLFPSPSRMIMAAVMLVLAALIGFYALTSSPLQKAVTGEALVGGPFTMQNHRGETVTEKTYWGKPMLLVFGFTFCPDICPAELQVTTEALKLLGTKGENIQPLFVTIDPDRDTVETLASYVANFSPDLVGLTGSPQQVKAMADVYRVFFEKKPNQENPQAYTMNHTPFIYLMDDKGKFRKHFSYTTDAKALAEGIAAALALQ